MFRKLARRLGCFRRGGMAPEKDSDEVRLLEVEKLKKLIESAPNLNPHQQHYLIDRWLHQVRWWDKRARQANRWYFSLRVVIVVGGILVPFLMTVSISTQLDPWLRVFGSVVSLVVAACAGLEALYGWGGFWLEKRRAGELLKVEGWLFFHSAGPYKGQDSAGPFAEFVYKVESQIAAEVGEYVATARRAQDNQQPPPKKNGEEQGGSNSA